MYSWTWLLLILVVECNVSRTKRMVGGKLASRRPCMVHLHRSSKFFCGGTLYNSGSVITAAHCNVRTTSKWTAHTNRYNIGLSIEKDGGSVSLVKKRINHPDYNETNNDYDISIWLIFPPIESGVRISLKRTKLDHTNTIATILGWSETRIQPPGFKKDPNYKFQPSKLLQKAIFPLLIPTECQLNHPYFNASLMICTGDPTGNRGACLGDSGGPIFIDKIDHIMLVGAISHSWGCGYTNQQMVGTKISNPKILSFIKDLTSQVEMSSSVQQ